MPKLFSILSLFSLTLLLLGAPLFSQEGVTSLIGEKREPMNTSGPISISADHMTADDARRLITFSGRVVARQGNLIISCDNMRVSYQPKGSYIPPTNSSGNTGVDSSEITEPLIIPEETNAQNQETLKSQRTSENQRKENTANASIPTMVQSSKSTPTSGQEIDKVECEGAVKIQEGERLAVAEKVLYLAKASPRRLVLTGDARVWQGQNSITGHQITYYLDENRSLVDSVGSQRVRAFYDQGGRNN